MKEVLELIQDRIDDVTGALSYLEKYADSSDPVYGEHANRHFLNELNFLSDLLTRLEKELEKNNDN